MDEKEGYVSVTVVGKLINSTLNYSTKGDAYVKGKVGIPFVSKDGDTKYRFINFMVWRDLAEIVAEIPEDSWVKMEGDLRTSSYESNCSSCGAPVKMYWTDVNVTNVDLM